jgi:hypothetical protein
MSEVVIDQLMTPANIQVIADSLFFARINMGDAWGVDFLAIEKLVHAARRLSEDKPTRLIPWNDLHEWEHLLTIGRKFFWRGANQRLYLATLTQKVGGDLMAITADRTKPSLVYIEQVERILLENEIVELTREER